MATSEYGNPAKVRDLLFDMFLNFVRQDDFGNLTDDGRREIVDQVVEIKNTMIDGNESNKTI